MLEWWKLKCYFPDCADMDCEDHQPELHLLPGCWRHVHHPSVSVLHVHFTAVVPFASLVICLQPAQSNPPFSILTRIARSRYCAIHCPDRLEPFIAHSLH